MSPHILLLRAVNVGGNNRLPMKDFAAIVAAAGGVAPRTYIQSGNAVCGLDPGEVDRLRRDVADAIEAKFGFRAPVVVRSLAELRTVIAKNPWPERVDQLHVGFCADEPKAGAVLDPDRSPGDSFQLVGRDVYLHYTGGAAGTKLTSAWFDRALGTTITVRNWRTVLALAALATG